MTCPYCNKTPRWVDNTEIYGKRYGKSYMMYWCKPCDAYVGCHNNTKEALGTLANKELREWRKKAHAAFDPLWKSNKIERWWAYHKLDTYFGKEMHIGETDIETCKQIIEWVKNTFDKEENEF